MSGKDPFEDLLDLGDGSAPPLPSSQPPQADRWMVLGDGEEDFKSLSEDDLFGSGPGSSSKAHGSTFDDLFGEGYSDKKQKKSTGHGSTFDDLFGEDKSSKGSKKGTTFEDMFPEESDPKSNSSSTATRVAGNKQSDGYDEDLFGSLSSKVKSSEKSDIFNSKNNEDELDELFGSKKTKESGAARKEKGDPDEEALEPTSPAPVTAPEESPTTREKHHVDALLGLPEETKSLAVSSVMPEPDLVRDTESTKKQSSSHTFEDLFGDESGPKQHADLDDLFGVPSQRFGKGVQKKPEKNLDDIFGDSSMQASSSKSDTDDLFGGSSSTVKLSQNKSAEDISVANRTAETKSSSTNTDLKDLFSSPPHSTGSEKAAADKPSDGVDGNVDILVSTVKDSSKRASTSSQGEGEDLDFSVIQDTSLLDPNITRHKSSLRKRGSLARRKKPTRSSMRRVIQEGDAAFTYRSSDKPRDEEDDDEDEEKRTGGGDEVQHLSPSRSEKGEGDQPAPAPAPEKKSPVVGGKMLIGPDVLGQSQLMKGLAGLKSRQSSKPKPENDANSAATLKPEPVKSQESHKPIITPTKPQPSDMKSSSSGQNKPGSLASKPDVVMSTLQRVNKQDKTSAFSSPLKPSVGVSDSPSKVTSVTLEKVSLRSTRSSSSPPEPKAISEESNVILSERKNSLRRVSPAKSKESDEPKEDKKSQPTWLNEMKLRTTPRKVPDPSVSKPETSSKSDGDSVKVTLRPALQPRARDVDSSRVSENKPLTPRKPPVDRPKPKIEGSKPTLSVNGKGDAPSRSPLGVKEENTASPTTSVPSWRRELAERKKKRKDDPMTMSTPSKMEAPPDVAANWRTQLSQKKRRSITSSPGDMKPTVDNKQQPEWALQAEQRRARLAKSGLIGQK